MKKDFLVVFEIGKTSFGATAPDIPGCFAVGPTLDETRLRFLEAVESHLRWMAEDNDPIPRPVTTTYDFARSTEDDSSAYYVEWLPISMPNEARLAISA
jgi:predicted RNase H-like HicB family nuclease